MILADTKQKIKTYHNCIAHSFLQVLSLPGYVLYFLTALHFHISVRIFCNLFICLVFDGPLQSICLGVFCFKHSITFDTYLLSCRFHVVDIFYIDFRPCETFAITNSGAMLLLIKILSNSRTMKCWFILYLQMCTFYPIVQIQMFSISCLAFLHFTFHWYLHGSN